MIDHTRQFVQPSMRAEQLRILLVRILERGKLVTVVSFRITLPLFTVCLPILSISLPLFTVCLPILSISLPLFTVRLHTLVVFLPWQSRLDGEERHG